MIRAVIIGFSHMHVNEVALYLSEQPDFELVGAAGVKSNLPEIPPLRYTPKWNLENVKTNYCSNIYDDYKAMLDELKPDIAFILSENAAHCKPWFQSEPRCPPGAPPFGEFWRKMG